MATIYIHYIFFPFFQFNTWEFHFNLLLCIVYICACISFWLISFYLWLVLVFLFSKISYRFTPLPHCMSRHYTSQQYPKGLKATMWTRIIYSHIFLWWCCLWGRIKLNLGRLDTFSIGSYLGILPRNRKSEEFWKEKTF